MKIIYLFTFFLLFSCKNSEPVKKSIVKTATDINHKEIEEKKSEEPIEVVEELVIPKTNTEPKFNILLSGTYRDSENDNPANYLTRNWLDLYEKDGNYYLKQANFTISKSLDECSGDSTQTVESKNKTLLFINNSNLQLGEIDNQKITKNKIWPNEEMIFVFNNDVYKLRAEGDIISSENVNSEEGTDIFHKVENYKLFILVNDSKEFLFLEESSFNDTFVELLFVGDIDNDNKLDFIFGANRYYEEKRVILYLSSEADENEIIKKSGEISIGFDC